MVVPRKAVFSQFGGLTGDLESGSRKRQGLAEARRTAQSRARARARAAMRVCIVLGLVILAMWAYFILTVVFGSKSHFGPDEGHPRIRVPGIWTHPDMIGWNLLERLFAIGNENPAELARVLEEEDPFKVAAASPSSFECPRTEAERFSFPDLRNRTAEQDFKRGKGFVYYQHLRKAGGTGFCEMAGRNMIGWQVPDYHCMPDNRGSMATPPWSSREFLLNRMRREGHRITANEWDAFPAEHLNLPGAVFGTTFRHPVDRWYSQYRFEHVEHRDGTKADSVPLPFEKWYERMKPYIMGDNYYVKTFCGRPNPPDDVLKKDLNGNGVPKYQPDLCWSYHKFNSWGQKVQWEDFAQAVEILRRFNLILVLDFVDDEQWALEEGLGWTQTRKQVLPHERQAVRLNKKSIPAREALEPRVWAAVLHSNVFDLLLFHWAKRMYLERSACRGSRDVGVLSR